MGPNRVWLKDAELPGLAMSRSLGDYVAQSVGVIPEPGKFFYFLFDFFLEINVYDIKATDRFFILASDGVWEFLTNE